MRTRRLQRAICQAETTTQMSISYFTKDTMTGSEVVTRHATE